jgi:hypothetical protein
MYPCKRLTSSSPCGVRPRGVLARSHLGAAPTAAPQAGGPPAFCATSADLPLSVCSPNPFPQYPRLIRLIAVNSCQIKVLRKPSAGLHSPAHLLMYACAVLSRNSDRPHKGKPLERVGRKATRLRPAGAGYGSRAAGRTQHLLTGCASRTARLERTAQHRR